VVRYIEPFQEASAAPSPESRGAPVDKQDDDLTHNSSVSSQSMPHWNLYTTSASVLSSRQARPAFASRLYRRHGDHGSDCSNDDNSDGDHHDSSGDGDYAAVIAGESLSVCRVHCFEKSRTASSQKLGPSSEKLLMPMLLAISGEP
jgi:hypothetical protein